MRPQITLASPLKRLSLSLPERVALVFFILFLALGAWIYRDFGVSWDEPVQVDLGIQNYNYALHGNPQLLANKDRFYGPLFEMLLVRLQDNRGEPRQLYLSRHFLTFLCFYLGCVGFYFLCRRLFRSPWLALAGVVGLVASPRIFSNAFYNSKDIPFLVFYVLSLLSLVCFLDHPRLLTALIHAGASAALIDTRLPGIILPALTLGGLGFEVLAGRRTWKRAGRLFLAYLGACAGLTLLFWPVLWQDPLGGLANAFAIMSHYPVQLGMLYLGQMISSTALPWHYIPVWIGVTTPLSYLALFCAGLVVMVGAWFMRGGLRLRRERRNDLLVLAACFGPPLTVIALQSVLYDAWRQMFFIYPPMILIALRALEWCAAALPRRLPRWLLAALLAVLALDTLLTAGWMVANHPNEEAYFNRLAGADMLTIQQRFMVDYWGLSYRQGLEYITKTDPAPVIPVFVETSPGQSNLALLPVKDALRIHVVKDFRQAKYFIGNYYLTQAPYPLKDEVFSVRVGDAKILSVYRLLPNEVD